MEAKIQELERKINELEILIREDKKVEKKNITSEEINLLPEEEIKQILKLSPETYLELKDKEKYLSYLLELNPENIQYIENQEETIIKYNLIEKYQRSSLIKFIKNPSKEIMNKIIFHKSTYIDCIPNREQFTMDEMRNIMEKKGPSIKFFKQDKDELEFFNFLINYILCHCSQIEPILESLQRHNIW